MPDFKAKQLALVYLGERPEEKRDEEEIKELDAVYKAGTKVFLIFSIARHILTFAVAELTISCV